MHRPASKVRRKSLKMGKFPSSNALNIKELAKGVNPLSDPSLSAERPDTKQIKLVKLVFYEFFFSTTMPYLVKQSDSILPFSAVQKYRIVILHELMARDKEPRKSSYTLKQPFTLYLRQ